MAKLISHHRSLALAERHRRELERKTKQTWKIISRRRSDGHYSSSGHTFTFESEEKKEVFEWIVSFTYDKSGRSFDIIVTARDETEAYQVAVKFLRDDPVGRSIVSAGFSVWTISIAKGSKTDEAQGEAEYRSKSRARRGHAVGSSPRKKKRSNRR